MANELRGIPFCGECAHYNYQKHKCAVCACEKSNPQDPFYDDCPLPKVVEVVRCKDCYFYRIDVEYYGGGTKDICKLFKRQMHKDDFCSYGERRKE